MIERRVFGSPAFAVARDRPTQPQRSLACRQVLRRSLGGFYALRGRRPRLRGRHLGHRESVLGALHGINANLAPNSVPGRLWFWGGFPECGAAKCFYPSSCGPVGPVISGDYEQVLAAAHPRDLGPGVMRMLVDVASGVVSSSSPQTYYGWLGWSKQPLSRRFQQTDLIASRMPKSREH